MSNKSKKIILFTDAWQPQVNGVVRCVEAARNFLEKNNFKVTVIHPGLFYSLPLPFYPEIRIALFARYKIRKMIKELSPEYIHIFTEGPIGLSARYVCLKNKIKFTTSHHTNFQHYVQYYIKFKIPFVFESIYTYLRWFHNKSNGTMVITNGLKKNLEKRGFLHLFLWPLGVDLDLFKRNDKSAVIKKYNFKSPVFIYFGRISKEKNVEEYLSLKLSGTKLVVGDGPMRKNLEKKYFANNIFLGYKKGKELVDILSICDVFVFPSMTDAFPLAIIEALACGLPVAAHDVMDLSDLVRRDVGVLSKNLEAASLECLNISKERCRQYALNFSWDNSANYFIGNLVENYNPSNEK